MQRLIWRVGCAGQKKGQWLSNSGSLTTSRREVFVTASAISPECCPPHFLAAQGIQKPAHVSLLPAGEGPTGPSVSSQNFILGNMRIELVGTHSKATLGSPVPHPRLEWMECKSKMLLLHRASNEDRHACWRSVYTHLSPQTHKGTIHHNCDIPGCTSSLAGRSFLPTPHRWLETTYDRMQTLLLPFEH